jgi:hypothetical protein
MTSGKNAGLYREIAGTESHGSYPTLQVADGTFTVRTADPGLTHTTVISNADELQAIADDLDGNYYLTGDIDASATSGWNGGNGFVPIDSFTGTLDGCGYTISGLTCAKSGDHFGLFEDILAGATVANLTLADVAMSGRQGGALAYALNASAVENCIIQNCHVSGTITAIGSSISYIGGLVAGIYGWDDTHRAYLYDCTSSVSIDASSGHTDTSISEFGGLVGEAGVYSTIINCRATGNIIAHTSVNSAKHVGGLVGYTDGGSTTDIIITDCAATGDITSDDYSAGLCGFGSGVTFTRCSARGDISITDDYAAGFIADAFDSVTCIDCYSWGGVESLDVYAGGFVQYDGSQFNSYTNCYSVGLIEDIDEEIGGFCQASEGGTITASFWDTESSGVATSDGGTGYITEWMQTQANYEAAGWDFNTTWEMDAIFTSPDITEHTITFVTPFPYEVERGDRYCISGVPFKARCWPLQEKGVPRMNRWNMAGGALKCLNLSGFTSNDNAYWRVSGYRNGSNQLVDTDVYITVDQNPADSAGAINMDGVYVEPYVEQIAAGVVFELTNAEFNVTETDSRKVAD